MSDRQNRLNLNLDQVFGVPGTHECRVCGADLEDGRKQYCSSKCRNVAYAVISLYRWGTVRERVLERDSYTCQECGEDVEDGYGNAHVDHIVPISKAGSPLDPQNLRTLCASCNTSKGDKMPGKDMEMDRIPIREFLALKVDEKVLSGGNMWDRSQQPHVDGEERVFRCPKCGHGWISLEEALSEESCSNCGVNFEVRVIAGRDPR